MTSTIAIHSFRRGTGKSTVAANLAVLLADSGRRVGLIDANFQSPSLHLFFGQLSLGHRPALNDYLAGRCDFRTTVIDVTDDVSPPPIGAIFLVPTSGEAGKILESLRGDSRAESLNEGLAALSRDLGLDVLLVDTAAGLSEETLLTISAADRLLLLLRPDHQDYHGTGVVIELARRLGAPMLHLLVNEVPASFDMAQVALRVATGFGQPVATALPHSEELQMIGSRGLLVRCHPNSLSAQVLRRLVAGLV